MNWTHVHLALNHVSVVGTPFLILLLGWGWFRKNDSLVRLALGWTAGFAVISIALKFTGDFAAEQDLARLEPVRAWVEAHEQTADQATAAIFVLGVSAGAALFLGRKGRAVPSWALATVLLLGLLTTLMLARTANAGGQIGHPELRPREAGADGAEFKLFP